MAFAMEYDLAACTRGDKTAWDAFVDRFTPVLYAAVSRTARTRGRNDDGFIQDAVQEVLVRLIKEDYLLLKSYDPSRSSLSTWLTLVARSKTLDILKQSRHEPDPTDQEVEEVPAPEPVPTKEVRIPPGLLSPRQNLVLRLVFDQEMEVPEIARVLRVSHQTVRSAKHKAVSKLRNHFL